MNELTIGDEFIQQDIKKEAITETQLEEMKELSGSYEALFSRVSRKYKALGLKNISLTEADYKQYILDEYTFLKRPVFIVDREIFIGNAKKTQLALAEKLAN